MAPKNRVRSRFAPADPRPRTSAEAATSEAQSSGPALQLGDIIDFALDDIESMPTGEACSLGELRDFCFRYAEKGSWLREHATGELLELTVMENILCKGVEDLQMESMLARENRTQASTVWLFIELEHITPHQMVDMLAFSAQRLLNNGYFVLNHIWFKRVARGLLKLIHDQNSQVGHRNYIRDRNSGELGRQMREMPDARVPADDDILVDDDEQAWSP